jgi:superfamily I DNA/RNA helicase
LWSIFERVRGRLVERGLTTLPAVFRALTERLEEGATAAYDYVVLDESQDVSVAGIRFLAAIGARRPNALFFTGDLGQRIFQQPFSWKSVGVDLRGRSRTLRVNYRTSHQIRSQADRLLDPETSDVDGNRENRRGTVSVFNGPPPLIRVFESEADEIAGVARWLRERVAEGFNPGELAIFVRSANEQQRAKAAASEARRPFEILDERVRIAAGRISIATMHLAKGLEFRAVVVMACDDEVIPSQPRIESVGDDADLEEVYKTERHLLYVACTRARDQLLVTSGGEASEFLDDLGSPKSVS